ncbi:MAG: hypothetical protein LQ346_000746 [Caloplaca aetnensis]|nr:MAG: hypothetical protein LQ346_000746 [Caloplaca aetnensis]
MKLIPKPSKRKTLPSIPIAERSLSPIVAQPYPKRMAFPFLRLSGEIRNQIYLDIIGPEIPRTRKFRKTAYGVEHEFGPKFWPMRRFSMALLIVNRQIHGEFSDIVWDVLSVEWRLSSFELDKDDLRLFTSMKRLQRCKLIISIDEILRSTYIDRHGDRNQSLDDEWSERARDSTASGKDIELTIFGLAYKLNRMPQLKEIHIEYWEGEGAYDDEESYWVLLRDGSLHRYVEANLIDVFGTELRGMTKVQISGTLCDECAALFASAMERPKEVLPDVYMQEPERCIPRDTVPQWNDKIRGWV